MLCSNPDAPRNGHRESLPFERVALAPHKCRVSPTTNETTCPGATPPHDIWMKTTSDVLGGTPTMSDELGATGEDPHAHVAHRAGNIVPHTTAGGPAKVIAILLSLPRLAAVRLSPEFGRLGAAVLILAVQEHAVIKAQPPRTGCHLDVGSAAHVPESELPGSSRSVEAHSRRAAGAIRAAATVVLVAGTPNTFAAWRTLKKPRPPGVDHRSWGRVGGLSAILGSGVRSRAPDLAPIALPAAPRGTSVAAWPWPCASDKRMLTRRINSWPNLHQHALAARRC
jgi:hypothetical protein